MAVMMTLRAWLFLFLLSVIWGAAFTFSGAAVREVNFISVVFLRVGIAASALACWLILTGGFPKISLSLLGAFLIMGLINNAIPFSLLFWAQSPAELGGVPKVSSGLAAVFNATTPIFTMLVAHFALTDEKMSVRKGVGIILGIFGVLVLFLGQLAPSSGAEIDAALTLRYLGFLACICAAFSYGFGAVFGRGFKKLNLTPSQGAFGQLLGSSLIMLPFVLLIDQPWTSALPSLSFWGAILGLALVSSAFAYLIYFWLLEHAGAVNTALVTLLVPASAIILGLLFLQETFGAYDAIGLGLIVFGLLVIDGRVFARFSTRAS